MSRWTWVWHDTGLQAVGEVLPPACLYSIVKQLIRVNVIVMKCVLYCITYVRKWLMI